MLCSSTAWNQQACCFFGGWQAKAQGIWSPVFSQAMGSGISCFFKSQRQTSTTCGDVSSDLNGIWSYFPSRCFFPFLILRHFSHTSLQLFQDLGETIREVLKSFLILWNGSGFREKLFSHLFFLQVLIKKPQTWISSLFFCTSLYPFSACVHREKEVSETQNVKFYPRCCTSLV